MSAIVAALSGGDVGKLHLTWAQINRAPTLESLMRITDPIGGFSNYKSLHNLLSNETPCIPFISAFLTDLIHINDQYPNTIPTPAGPVPGLVSPRPLINFVKFQRLNDVVTSILKFSGRTYKGITENTSMIQTIEQQIEAAATKDAGFFWQQSQELQSAEIKAHSIWKNLNDAGF
jgi:son of sevenless-like protein